MDILECINQHYHIQLNEQQKKAMLHHQGPLLLLAVPGAGKTTVMCCRIANLIINHQVDPFFILTLTFSRAAARDMKHRFKSLFDGMVTKEVAFSTIHSFSYSVIMDYVQTKGVSFPAVIEDEQSNHNKYLLLRQIYQSIHGEPIQDDKLEELVSNISYVKNRMIKPKDFEEFDFSIQNFDEIFKQYEEYKKTHRMIDYDDMLTSALTILKSNASILKKYRERYPYINVDESQDTSMVQHKMIRLLAAPFNNLFMVGDEDQSIYRFRGAEPKALLEFKEIYRDAKILLMEENFRSVGSVVKAANVLIKNNRQRYDKNMVTQKKEGDPIHYCCFQEKAGQYAHIAEQARKNKRGESLAVLYRNHHSSIALADYLDRKGIVFYIRDTKTHFFKHWVTKDILCFMRLSQDETDVEAFEQIYFKLNAYLSKAMLEYIKLQGVKGHSIFDMLVGMKETNPQQKKNIENLKRTFKTLKKENPARFIQLLEEKFQYRQYLKEAGTRRGYSQESLNLVIATLKSIAGGATTIPSFLNRLLHLQRIMEQAKENRNICQLTLSTIHASKGLEYDTVLMMDLIENQFPSAMSVARHAEGFCEDLEEETRLFYVGITRAKKHLSLLSIQYCEGSLVKPSRFIDMLKGSHAQRIEEVKEVCKKVAQKGSGELCIDNMNGLELSIGLSVKHIKYGLGVIVDYNTKSDIIAVDFDQHGQKKLSLKLCIATGILRAVQ